MTGFVIVVLLFFGFSSAAARAWHIDAAGLGDAPSIQAAIDMSADGDSIILSAGTFLERLDLGQKSLSIIGTTAPSTVIDAEGNGRVIRIQNGLISNCTLRHGVADHGAGLLVVAGGHVQLRDNIIENNEAILGTGMGLGGGVHIEPAPATEIRIRVIGNTLRNNLAASAGGGVYDAGSAADIAGNMIVNNQAPEAGGIYSAASRIFGNTIVSNTAETHGAAILTMNASIENNTILNNHTNQSMPGVAIRAGSSLRIVNNIVMGNGNASGVPAAVISCSNSTLTCNDIVGNTNDLIVGSGNFENNFSQDPEFCSVDPVFNGSFQIQEDSPCAPFQSNLGDRCGWVGAHSIGCTQVGIEQQQWSVIKNLYR